jgi:Mn-dependent DtxR family transcriptional regulator
MGRGRPPTITDDRLLVEILLHSDRRVFSSELAGELPVSNQTVRDRMAELETEGYVNIERLDGGNLYLLSDDGVERLTTLLREEIT